LKTRNAKDKVRTEVRSYAASCFFVDTVLKIVGDYKLHSLLRPGRKPEAPSLGGFVLLRGKIFPKIRRRWCGWWNRDAKLCRMCACCVQVDVIGIARVRGVKCFFELSVFRQCVVVFFGGREFAISLYGCVHLLFGAWHGFSCGRDAAIES
jgi:hypothetical protein